MNARPSFAEDRRVVRRITSWRATCRVGMGTLSGVILDISAHGAFFAPGDAKTGAQVSAELAIDDRVALHFDRDPNLDGLELPARIMWLGRSPTHGRLGFGVEFSDTPL